MSASYPDLLRLKNLKATGSSHDDAGLTIDVVSRNPVAPRCCLLQSLKKQGTKPITCRDFAQQSIPVTLRIKRQRFECRQCGAVLYEDLPDVDTDRQMTARFRKHLERQSVDHPFSVAARDNGVHETLVRRVFHDMAERELAGYTFRLPRVLGMDEKHILGANRFVIGDVEKRMMLDLQPSRYTADLNAYFSAMDGRQNVEVVTQDMWVGYLKVTKKQFPNAVTVIDKFHVQRMANLGVEVVRKASYTGLDSRDRRILKRQNKLFLARWGNAKPEIKQRLEEIFRQFPALGDAYFWKERFFDLYEVDSRPMAEEALTRWCSDLPPELHKPFREALTAVGNWRPYILNYFLHPYTNAYIERLNGLVDTLNRNAAGLSYETLRAKAILRFGLLAKRKTIPELISDIIHDDRGSATIGWPERPKVYAGIDISTLEAAIRDGTF